MTSKSSGGKPVREWPVVVLKPPKTKVVLDQDQLLDYVTTRFVGMVIKRTRKGLDVDGKSFVSYSNAYIRQLAATGRGDGSRVDLTLTGGLLSSLGERRRQITKDRAEVWIGPSTSKGPALKYSSPPDGKPAMISDGTSKKTHAQIGSYHHRGKGHNPRREWLGLTRAEWRKLARELQKHDAALVSRRR